MAIIGGLIGVLGRFAGQILNTTLGWATLLLFGKVPQSRQMLLLVIVFGSLVWIALVIGVVSPPVGTLLIASVPMNDAIGENNVRMGMLAGAIALPALLGFASAVVSQDPRRHGPIAMLGSAVRGYPFAIVLTLMLGLLAAVGIGRKIRSLSRHWTDAHVPIIVKPNGYAAVLADVEDALDKACLEVTARDAGTLLSGPPKLLDKVAGRGLGDLVPDRLMLLVGENLEVLVYPSDLAISGTTAIVARARAALASRVSNAPAYLTQSAEAQKVEDILDRIRDEGRRSAPQRTISRLAEVDAELAKLTVAYEEWQVLYRLRLQLERDARAAMDHGASTISPELGEGPTTTHADELSGGLLPRPAALAIGLGGAALLAMDVALQLADRRSGDPFRNGH